MKKATYAAALLLFMISAVSTEAQYCAPDQPPGPPIAVELLDDTSFDWDCPSWVYAGYATRISSDPRYVRLNGSGHVQQTIGVGGPYSGPLSLDIDVSNSGGTASGTERLRIEILDQWGALVETVDMLSATSTDGHYNYSLYNYDNMQIVVRIRYTQATNPSGTVFNVENVALWAPL